jgi:hypoxanthine phosphoribosyltransferase
VRYIATNIELDFLYKKIAGAITKEGTSFDMILAISRGGLVPAAYLGHLLNITDVRTIGVESSEKKARVTQYPNPLFLLHKNILVVDDVLETEKTYSAVRAIFQPVLSEVTLRYAVLYHKNIAPSPDYYGKIVENVWIVFPWENL